MANAVADLVYREALAYAQSKGADPATASAYARVAVAIASGESSLNPAAVRDTRSGNDPLVSSGRAQREHSVGLFQLNFMGGRGTASGLTPEQAKDPVLNTRASMPDLWSAFQRNGGGQGFSTDPVRFTQKVYQAGQGSITPDIGSQVIPGLALTEGAGVAGGGSGRGFTAPRPAPVGPAGRTYDQITGTDYLTVDEMNWYRAGGPAITPPNTGGGMTQEFDAEGFPITPGSAPAPSSGGGGPARNWANLPIGTGIGSGAAAPTSPPPAPASGPQPVPGVPNATMVYVPQFGDWLVTLTDPVTGLTSQTWRSGTSTPGGAEPSKSIRINQDTGKAYVVDNQGNVVREAPEFNERPNMGAAAAAEAAKSIRVNQDTGKAYVVDNQGQIVRPIPEFDERPASAGSTAGPEGFTKYDEAGNPFVYNAAGQLVPAPPGTPKKTTAGAAPKKSVAQTMYEALGNVGGNRAANTEAPVPGTAPAGSAPASSSTPIPSGESMGNPLMGQDVYAPASGFGQAGQIAGAWVPTPGGGSMFMTPQNAQAITAAAYGTDSTGDPMKDLTGGAAAMADRTLMMMRNPNMSPAQIQSRFFDVPGGFERQKEAAANAALAAAGGLLKPAPEEEEGVTYPFDPIRGYAEGGTAFVGMEQEPPAPPQPQGPFNPQALLDPSQVQVRPWQPEPFYGPDWQQVLANRNVVANNTNQIGWGNLPRFPFFADGGSITVGKDEEEDKTPFPLSGMDRVEAPIPGAPPTPFAARDTGPRYTFNGNIQRTINGQSMTMPATGGNFRDSDQIDVSKLLERYKSGPWAGWKNFGPESNMDEIYQHFFPIWLQSQGRQFRNLQGGGAWDWSDYNAPILNANGKTYRFANGGNMMLDEPVVGMGLQSGQPKFLAGEAGPERLDFTPQGAAPPVPPMGMQPPMQPPMPQIQGRTHPELLAMFAKTMASKMRPMGAVPA